LLTEITTASISGISSILQGGAKKIVNKQIRKSNITHTCISFWTHVLSRTTTVAEYWVKQDSYPSVFRSGSLAWREFNKETSVSEPSCPDLIVALCQIVGFSFAPVWLAHSESDLLQFILRRTGPRGSIAGYKLCHKIECLPKRRET